MRFDVGLADGAVLTVDSVVLALGHLESRLNPEQRELQAAAEEFGLLYLPPAAPADVDWSLVPAVKPVLVRGMGLNFFDAMGQLTEGRGGRFLPGDGRRAQLPSLRPRTAHHRGLAARHPVPGQGDPRRLLPRRRDAEVLHRKRPGEIRGGGNPACLRPRPLASPAPRRPLGLLLHAGALAAGRHPDGTEGVPEGTGGGPAPACALRREMGRPGGLRPGGPRPACPSAEPAGTGGTAGREVVRLPRGTRRRRRRISARRRPAFRSGGGRPGEDDDRRPAPRPGGAEDRRRGRRHHR